MLAKVFDTFQNFLDHHFAWVLNIFVQSLYHGYELLNMKAILVRLKNDIKHFKFVGQSQTVWLVEKLLFFGFDDLFGYLLPMLFRQTVQKAFFGEHAEYRLNHFEIDVIIHIFCLV